MSAAAESARTRPAGPPAAEHDPATGVDVRQLMGLRAISRTLPPLELATTGRPGGFASRRRGTGFDIRDVRPFLDGDDIRHVDPMATARTGKLHVRTFHEEQDRTVLLVADFRRPMLWGTRQRLRSVAAARALACAGWQAHDLGGRIGALVVTDEDMHYERPRSGTGAMARIAGCLSRGHADAIRQAAAGTGPPTPLRTALDRLARISPPGATLFLATALDDLGTAPETAFLPLVRRTRPIVLLMRDAVERERPGGTFSYLDGRRQHRIGRFAAMSGSSDGLLEAVRALGIGVRAIDTDWEPDDGDRS